MSHTELPFQKMRLMPVANDDSAEVQRKLEKHVRNANPIVTAMARTIPHTSGYKMPQHRRGTTGAAALLAAQNAHLRRYIDLQKQLTKVDVSLPPPPPPSEPPSAVDSRSILLTAKNVKVPVTYKAKFSRLLQHLQDHPDAISSSDANELVIDGRVLRGTNYRSALRSLYVNVADPAPGTRELIHKLKGLGVPKAVLSSKIALAAYGQKGSGLRHGRVLRVY